MRGLLVTAVRAAGVYAVIAVLIVVGSRLWGRTVWVPAVAYAGPAVYFVALVVMNRFGFRSIRNATLRWVVCVAACALLTAVSGFLVFVLAVNVHLSLGGQL